MKSLQVVEEWCKAAGHPYLMLIGSTDITKRADIVSFNDIVVCRA